MLISCVTIEGSNIESNKWFKVRIPLESNVLMEGRLFLRSLSGIGRTNDTDHALLCNVIEIREENGEEIFKMYGEWKSNTNERSVFMFESDMKICLTKVYTRKKFIDMEIRFSLLLPATEIWYPEKLTGVITATRQYPPIRLSTTSNSTNVSNALYGNGVYNVSASSETTARKARDAFDLDGNSWRPAVNAVGEYIQLEVPTAFVLHSFEVTTELLGGRPKQFKIEGSNDATFATKTLLNTTNWDTYSPALNAIIVISPVVFTPFKYFRLTVTELIGAATGFLQLNYPLRFFEGSEKIDYGPYPGTGNYTCNASTATASIFRAFDRTYLTFYAASSDTYSSTGVYVGAVSTLVQSVSYLGDWVQIDFPYPIFIKAFRYWIRSGFSHVKDVVMVGYTQDPVPSSNVIWQGIAPDSTLFSGWFLRSLTTPGFYSSIRMIASSGYGNRFRVEELAFIGAQETMVGKVPQSVQLSCQLQI